MAKSLRSKRKRKLRAEKRIVNAKKELVKLKSIVSNFAKANPDTMDIVRQKGQKKLRDKLGDTSFPEEFMEIDQDEHDQQEELLADDRKKSKQTIDGNSKDKAKQSLSLKNEHGNYPVWMNLKKIKSIKQKIKRHNKNKIGKAGHSIVSRKSKKHIKR